jgi:exosome complex component RRP40
VGQVVLCHVISADKNFDVELSCEDPTTPKDWVTNEVYFGHIQEGGLIVTVPVNLSKRLIEKNCPVFPIIGQYLKPFELAIGVNGRIYIKTSQNDPLRAVLIGEILRKCGSMKLEDIEKMCQDMERRLS